jgi:hypothetical protein
MTALFEKSRSLLLEGRSARTPPSTFLFLPIHLSNSPETLRFPTSRRAEKPTKFEPPTSSRRSCPHISEELLEARYRAVKRTARRMSEVIWARHCPCQHESSILRTAAFPAIPASRPSLEGAGLRHSGRTWATFIRRSGPCWGSSAAEGIRQGVTLNRATRERSGN